MRYLINFFIPFLLAFSLASGAFAQEKKINKSNLVIKEWNTDVRSNTKVLDHMTVYNSDGKKIDEIEYEAGGVKKWQKRYEHGADGRVAKEILYDGHGRITSIKKFEYNEFGRKKVQYTYNPKGKLLTVKNYEYLTVDADE